MLWRSEKSPDCREPITNNRSINDIEIFIGKIKKKNASKEGKNQSQVTQKPVNENEYYDETWNMEMARHELER